jgi:hypothetical protein
MKNQYRILGFLLGLSLLPACSDGGGGNNSLDEGSLTGTEQPAVDANVVFISTGDDFQSPAM